MYKTTERGLGYPAPRLAGTCMGTPALISLPALERALSAPRLQAYRMEGDPDAAEGLARYLWNMALVAAIQPALHALEVTFRNEVMRAASKIVPGRIASDNAAALAAGNPPVFQLGASGSWLTASPSLLKTREAERVTDALGRLGSDPKSQSEGHLVAKLSFGFFLALTRNAYNDTWSEGPRLWPNGLKHAFRHRPEDVTTNSQVYHHFDSVRAFRNRVAHHEPVWDRDYLAMHTCILDSLAWMSPKLADTLRVLSAAPTVFGEGPSKYRDVATRILGGLPAPVAHAVQETATNDGPVRNPNPFNPVALSDRTS